jgi:hypothetical protein
MDQMATLDVAGTLAGYPRVWRKQWLGKNWGINVAYDRDGLLLRAEFLEIVPPDRLGRIIRRMRPYLRLR